MAEKNKEKTRRCSKCGRSPVEDPNITLFRFPKPGKTNTVRCELWAKYLFPDQDCSSPKFQYKLHSEHRMLCNKHFALTSFSDYPLSNKKLHRFASPEGMNDMRPSYIQNEKEINLPPVVSLCEAKQTTECVRKSLHMPVQNYTNVVSTSVMEPQPGPSHITYPSACKAKLRMALQETTNTFSDNMLNKQNLPDLKKITPGKENMFSRVIPVTDLRTTAEDKKIKKQRQLATCRKHIKKICQLRRSVDKLKNKYFLRELNKNDSIAVLMKKVTPTFALLLQSQIKNLGKKSRGRRWTMEEKVVALRLYKRSPTCYRLMRRLFCLPAQSSLKSLLSKFSLEVGINKQIFAILRKAARTRKASDNEYVLMFDEMSIKKNLTYNKKKDIIEGFQDHALQGRCSQVATHALVFMLAGIRKKVKQPIAYYLSSGNVTADRLAVLIKEILRECYQTGISVATTVCDMCTVNRKALSILGATVDRPIISVDNVELVTLFDPPHLLKCFRNLFLKYNIKCTTEIQSNNTSGIGVAKWVHIKQFYELDNMNPNFVFAPALKPHHFNPNTQQKMKVKLAAEVLSHTVAAGMMAKISEGQLTTEAAVTVDVISKMDKLFDAVNSDSTDLRRGKMFSTNLKNTTPHIFNHFTKMKMFFKNLKFVDCKNIPPSQEGWVWTINGIEILWKKLTNKHLEIKSLATRRLQQDPLENLFGCIRGNCGANRNPTAGQFIAALKTAIMTNLTHQGTGNCEQDENEAIINNYKLLLTNKCSEEHTAHASFTEVEEIMCSSNIFEEFEKIYINEVEASTSELQACAYVCGFLIKKLATTCDFCKKILINNENMLPEHLFVEMKEYDFVKKSLYYSSKRLIDFIEICATETNKMLRDIGHEEHILKKVTIKLRTFDADFLKHCPAHWENNLNFFIRSVTIIIMKRFCSVKNRTFAEEAAKKSLKTKIDILKNK